MHAQTRNMFYISKNNTVVIEAELGDNVRNKNKKNDPIKIQICTRSRISNSQYLHILLFFQDAGMCINCGRTVYTNYQKCSQQHC